MKKTEQIYTERKEKYSFQRRLFNRLIKETFCAEISRWKQIHYEINTYGAPKEA